MICITRIVRSCFPFDFWALLDRGAFSLSHHVPVSTYTYDGGAIDNTETISAASKLGRRATKPGASRLGGERTGDVTGDYTDYPFAAYAGITNQKASIKHGSRSSGSTSSKQ